MPVVGKARTFHKKYAFTCEIEKIESAHFTKVGPIDIEVADVDQWEGGSLIPIKEPGRVTVADAVCERGVATGDVDLWDWFQQVVKVSANGGNPTPNFKRDAEVIQMDRDATVLRRYNLANAYPKKMVFSDWDNSSDENMLETMTLRYDFPEIIDLTKGGR